MYDKNILKYAQILVTNGRFMIFHIEGHSNIAIVLGARGQGPGESGVLLRLGWITKKVGGLL